MLKLTLADVAGTRHTAAGTAVKRLMKHALQAPPLTCAWLSRQPDWHLRGTPQTMEGRCQRITSMVRFYYVVFEQQAANLPPCTSELSATRAGRVLSIPTCQHHAADDGPGSHTRHVRPNTLCHERPCMLPGHHHVRDAAKVTVQPAAGSTVATGQLCVRCTVLPQGATSTLSEGASCNGSQQQDSPGSPPAGGAVPRSSHVDDVGCCQEGGDHLPPVLLRCDSQG